jgi:predicted ATP-dependent endonuclease of OLD family
MTNYEIYSQFSEISKLNLDSTYFYLAQALKKEKVDKPELSNISDLIKSWLNVEILKDENGFYQFQDNNKIYAPLMADGIKKFATLKYLMDNNSINSNSILFIDEPEVHLNPILISKYVELIIALAERGIQIFLSSHDYLFTYLLSLHAEYKKDSNCTIKYLSLVESTDGTKIDSGNVIADLKSNAIVEEYDKLLEVEHSYFFKE